MITRKCIYKYMLIGMFNQQVTLKCREDLMSTLTYDFFLIMER